MYILTQSNVEYDWDVVGISS